MLLGKRDLAIVTIETIIITFIDSCSRGYFQYLIIEFTYQQFHQLLTFSTNLLRKISIVAIEIIDNIKFLKFIDSIDSSIDCYHSLVTFVHKLKLVLLTEKDCYRKLKKRKSIICRIIYPSIQLIVPWIVIILKFLQSKLMLITMKLSCRQLQQIPCSTANIQ